MPTFLPASRLRTAGMLAASAALVAVLGGCGDGSGGDAVSPELPGAATSLAVPPVTGLDEDPADPATWIVSGEGVGSIRIGERFDDTLDGLPGEWRRIPDCGAEWTGADGVTVTFVRDGADIAAIEVSGSIGAPSQAPRTNEGLGLGSMRDEVTAVYPSFSERASGEAGVVHPAGDAGVAFELSAGDRVVGMIVAADDAPSCGTDSAQQ